MGKQYDESDEHKPVMLRTPTEMLLKDIMVALKQTRTELHKIVLVLAALAKQQGADVNGIVDGSRNPGTD